MVIIVAMVKIALKELAGILSGFFHRICVPFHWLLYAKMAIIYKYMGQSMSMLDIDERNMIF